MKSKVTTSIKTGILSLLIFNSYASAEKIELATLDSCSTNNTEIQK